MTSIKTISIAASKSYLQRAIAISALAKGSSELRQVTWCNDSKVAKKIAEDLGNTIIEKDGVLSISNEGLRFKNTSFTAGEAGLSIRMFSPIFALYQQTIIFEGKGSLKMRPMNIVVEALVQLGVKVEMENGFLPLKITGPINAGEIEIDGSLSSQLLTGLLIALPLAGDDSIIKVKNLKSKPYIDMTLSIMEQFGITVEHDNYKIFRIKGNQKYKATAYNVEGDWSGGAFFLVYGAVKNEIIINNLDYNSKQADKAIIKALELAGAKVSILEKGIKVEKDQLKAFSFDATDCPDLFPPLVCLASQCEGTSKIKGVSRLIHKESNRAEVLKQEFAKMGVEITLDNDEMYIVGSTPKACTIDSHNDHRIAMAGGIMNLFCDGEIKIKNKESINKSYPDFFKDLENILNGKEDCYNWSRKFRESYCRWIINFGSSKS